jgi:hypothetical protein
VCVCVIIRRKAPPLFIIYCSFFSIFILQNHLSSLFKNVLNSCVLTLDTSPRSESTCLCLPIHLSFFTIPVPPFKKHPPIFLYFTTPKFFSSVTLILTHAQKIQCIKNAKDSYGYAMARKQ